MFAFISEILQLLVHVCWALLITVKCCFQAIINRVSPQYKDLSNDIVLITGAGHGIGQLMCLKLAPLVSKVVAVDINAKGLELTKSLYGKLELKHKSRIFTYQCDLRSISDIDQLIKKIKQDVGIVTICINNAGIVNGKFLLNVSYEEFLNLIKVNLLAYFYLIQKLLPNMLGEEYPKYARMQKSGEPALVSCDPDCATKPARGHIVCINSVAGTVPAAGLSDYCASKAAAVLMCEGLREELAAAMITPSVKITNCMPYFIDTGMFHGVKCFFPGLMPMLTPQSAAEQIIEAIRLDMDDVYLSRRFCLFPLVKHIFPYKAVTYLYSCLGSHIMMPSFQGKSQVYLKKSN